MRSLTPFILLVIVKNLWGLGNYTTSYSSFREVAYLTHRFYIYDWEIGKNRLDVEIVRTDRQNRVFNQMSKDAGYNLRFYFNPLPFLGMNLITTSGFNRYQAGSYAFSSENSLLAGELVLKNTNFYFRSRLGRREFQALAVPGSGFEQEHELKGQLRNFLFIGGLTSYTLAQSMNQRTYFSVEPTHELRFENLRFSFAVTGDKNRESYPLAQTREAKNLSGLDGTVKLQYPLFNLGSLNFEEAASFSDARYQLITSNNITAQNERMKAGLLLTPSRHTELELNLERSSIFEAKMAGFGDEKRSRKLFTALFNYDYHRCHLSFKRNLSLESVITPHYLNKNDRDILTDRLNLDMQLTIYKNLTSRLALQSVSEDLIYVERFMSGNTRTNRSYSLAGELNLGLSPVRFLGNFSIKANYLLFRFGAKRNSFSQIQDISLTTIYEGNPCLLPRFTFGVIGEDYFSHETGLYELDLEVLRRRLGVSLLYLPSLALSLTPTVEFFHNENYNPFTHARLPWWDKTAGVLFNWKFASQSELVGDIKNVRRSYGEENWLINISINYHF